MHKRTEIISILNKTYRNPKPFLNHRNAFELLVAVILSAQCTDERVNKITPLLFPRKRPCQAEDIIKMGETKLKEIIFPTGYYNSKSKAIMGCAKALIGKEVPSSQSELIKLPGVGAKTAQVVLAQYFHQDTFPVDTHVHRVANRLGITYSGNNRDKTERELKAYFPKEHWSKLHMQLILHGRKTCTAYRPDCGHCPLFKLCMWPEKTTYVSSSTRRTKQQE